MHAHMVVLWGIGMNTSFGGFALGLPFLAHFLVHSEFLQTMTWH